jgi:L-lysine 6-transaminase
MVRARRILEVIESDGLFERASIAGAQLRLLLEELAGTHAVVTEVRGRGLMCAFSLADGEMRDRVLTALRVEERVLLLGCGSKSIRFRPALTVSPADLAAGVAALDRVLSKEIPS